MTRTVDFSLDFGKKTRHNGFNGRGDASNNVMHTGATRTEATMDKDGQLIDTGSAAYLAVNNGEIIPDSQCGICDHPIRKTPHAAIGVCTECGAHH